MCMISHGAAFIVSDQWLCAVNAALCEIMHMMEITADYRTGFTDKMRIRYRMRDIVQPYVFNITDLIPGLRSALKKTVQNVY